ncbi:hypothetical protein [Streptomyces luteogriseus]|uniref:hypothetical protein n=1 Tax=Streptomyces luteogriseus TaxID=68233 RepID=UPI00262246E5|nr:hypothetical protein [uncultured Streptomyces sp.]
MSEFPQDEVQYDNQVSAEVAYEAAVARAGRTQHALILAEAQVASWKRRYVAAVHRAEAAEKRAEAAEKGGGEHGEESADGPSAAVCEAGSAHAFSD